MLECDEDYQPEDNEFADRALDNNGESYQDDKTALELAKILASDSYSFESGKTYNGDDENFDPYTTLSTTRTFIDYLLEQLGEIKTKQQIWFADTSLKTSMKRAISAAV